MLYKLVYDVFDYLRFNIKFLLKSNDFMVIVIVNKKYK